MEEVVDILWQRLCLITAKVKLPLRNDIVRIVAAIGNQCHLTNVSGVSEDNVTGTDKRVRQTAGVFLGDEVIAQFV